MAMIVTDEMITEQTANLEAQLDKLSAGIDNLKKEHISLVGMLCIVREYLADEFDIIDGPEGAQLPNRAMRLAQEIDELLAMVGG